MGKTLGQREDEKLEPPLQGPNYYIPLTMIDDVTLPTFIAVISDFLGYQLSMFLQRHDQAEEGGEVASGPHMTLHYPPEKFILDDASNLIIHHVRRQTTIHKEHKAKIKQLVRHFIPDLLFHTRQELSDDENNLEDDDEDEDMDEKPDEPGRPDNDGEDSKSATDRPTLAKDRDSKQQHLGSGNGSDSNNCGSGSAAKRKTRSNKLPNDTTQDNSSKTPDDRGKKDSSISSNRIKDEDDDGEGSGGDISANCNNNRSSSLGRNSGNNNNNNNNNNNTIKVKEENVRCVGGGGVNGVVSDVDRVSIKLEDIKKEEHEEDMDTSVGGNYTSGEEYRLFVCNNNWYLFLRLHQLLCQRLYAIYKQAVLLASQENKETNARTQNTALMLRLKPKCEIPLSACYPAVLEMVRNLLDGHLEYNAYEDSLREVFTIHAYHAFTLDKVVSGAVRQLQHLVCDEAPSQCTSAYLAEGRRGGAGGSLASADARAPLELQYTKNIEKFLADENCFKICSYKRSGTLTIELLDSEMDDSEDNASGAGGSHQVSASDGVAATTSTSPAAAGSSTWCSRGASPTLPAGVAEAQRWHDYIENYLSTYPEDCSLPAQLFGKAVFLMRNLSSWRRTIRRSHDSSERSPAMHIDDNTQCKFNMTSLKAVIVMNSDACMYKQQALHRAKKCHGQVSIRKRSQFRRFHNSWLLKHVTESASRATNSWFMGLSDGLRPNKTQLHSINKPDSAPFGSYNHYTFTLLEPGHKNSGSSSS